MRVEALPTPSDHVPALMARVKPLYLSRTYDVPLPNPDDPTISWEPESFLDKLARMKGRLLKGGEPDLEGVAKIVLSDWVRGRIPFFVAPPERPAELDAKEEALRKKKKGKEKEQVVGVTQKLGGIIQRNTFVGEDIKPLPDDGDEEEFTGFGDLDHDRGNGEDEEGVSEGDEGSNEASGADELQWDDVFKPSADDSSTYSRTLDLNREHSSYSNTRCTQC